MFFIEKTPETENAAIEYELIIPYFLSCYVLLPLFGFAYFKYFFGELLRKVNAFLFIRYARMKDPLMVYNMVIEDKIKRIYNKIQLVVGCTFILILLAYLSL